MITKRVVVFQLVLCVTIDGGSSQFCCTICIKTRFDFGGCSGKKEKATNKELFFHAPPTKLEFSRHLLNSRNFRYFSFINNACPL